MKINYSVQYEAPATQDEQAADIITKIIEGGALPHELIINGESILKFNDKYFIYAFEEIGEAINKAFIKALEGSIEDLYNSKDESLKEIKFYYYDAVLLTDRNILIDDEAELKHEIIFEF